MLRDLRCSYVDAEKLRFDFNAPKALAAEQLVAVEALVNRWIGEAHPVQVATALALTHTRQEKSLGRTARRVSDKGRERSTPRTPTEAASHTTSLVESSPAEMSHSLSLSHLLSHCAGGGDGAGGGKGGGRDGDVRREIFRFSAGGGRAYGVHGAVRWHTRHQHRGDPWLQGD